VHVAQKTGEIIWELSLITINDQLLFGQMLVNIVISV
jgi:hypothetical protein